VALVEIEMTRADGFAMKYKFSRGLLAILVVSVTFFYPLLAPVPHRIDEAHFKLIEKGMSVAQVEAIFGVPPGEHDCAHCDYVGMNWKTVTNLQDALQQFQDSRDDSAQTLPKAMAFSGGSIQFVRMECLTWSSSSGSFTICLDGDRRVTSTGSWPYMRRVPPWSSFWEKIFGKK
jgi:hypothetical protein